MGSTCAHHYPHTKFHQCSPYRTLDIWLFFISQSEKICKWGTKYGHSATTDYMGSTCTCAYHYPHTKFHQCRPYRTLDIWLFVISQLEQIFKWGIKYEHLVTTDHLCPPPLPTYQVWQKIGHCILIREWRFTFWCWRDLTSVQSSVHPYRQRYNWKLSGPSSI